MSGLKSCRLRLLFMDKKIQAKKTIARFLKKLLLKLSAYSSLKLLFSHRQGPVNYRKLVLIRCFFQHKRATNSYGGPSRSRTYGVSNVGGLQPLAFANYAYRPIKPKEEKAFLRWLKLFTPYFFFPHFFWHPKLFCLLVIKAYFLVKFAVRAYMI